jgi:CheB methylesterase
VGTVFLRSRAESWKVKLIVVIVTGPDDNGAAAPSEIHDVDGVMIAQTLEKAEQAAISRSRADAWISRFRPRALRWRSLGSPLRLRRTPEFRFARASVVLNESDGIPTYPQRRKRHDNVCYIANIKAKIPENVHSWCGRRRRPRRLRHAWSA